MNSDYMRMVPKPSFSGWTEHRRLQLWPEKNAVLFMAPDFNWFVPNEICQKFADITWFGVGSIRHWIPHNLNLYYNNYEEECRLAMSIYPLDRNEVKVGDSYVWRGDLFTHFMTIYNMKDKTAVLALLTSPHERLRAAGKLIKDLWRQDEKAKEEENQDNSRVSV